MIQKNILKIVFALTLLILSQSANANAIFVSAFGNDEVGTGSINAPYLTIQQAFKTAVGGTTVYVRSGTYPSAFSIKTAVSGSRGNYITISGYPGEPMPVIDFSSEKYLAGNRGFEISKNYWYIKNLIITGAGDNGIYINGSYNIIENCKVCFNRDAGIQISSAGAYNYLHNCDSYSNYDFNTAGGNADGFAVKLYPGPGNVLRGCRSWNNSDDGYDLFETEYPVIFDSCWAWRNGWGFVNNGYITTSSMNGNGFKVGGNYAVGHHRLTNCVAFGNKAKGFDQNNNNGGVTVINCTGYNNGTYNFSFPNDTVYLRDNTGTIVQTYYKNGQDTMVNNVSYLSGGVRFASHHNVQITNSWNVKPATAADFLNIDTSVAATDRYENGTIIQSTFMKLNKASLLVDAGTVFGLPYNGSKPDLGYSETSQTSVNIISIHLSADFINQNGYLNWDVINQGAGGKFIVERSYYDVATPVWSVIDSINTMGDSSTLNRYAYTDKFDQLGLYQYRIKRVNIDGSIAYSNIVKVKTYPTISNASTFSVYPNPTNGPVVVSYYMTANSYLSAALYNERGQQMRVLLNNFKYFSAGQYTIPIDMTSLRAGVYYLKMIKTDGPTVVHKILKVN
jgi:pectate disaccharide-lyase